MGSAMAILVCTFISDELWFVSPRSSPELVVCFLDLDEMEFQTSFNLH